MNASQIAEIRRASRLLVRELGFMSRNIAGTDLSPSSVHAIVEIGGAGTVTSRELGELLLLEKSTVSRLVKSLIKKDLVTEKSMESDARAKYLLLTSSGRRMLKKIDKYADRRVSAAIEPLSHTTRQSILTGLKKFSSALESERLL